MASENTKLVIVESPSKIKTLKKYLGDGYIIESSVGHIRDLPKKDLGIDEVTFNKKALRSSSINGSKTESPRTRSSGTVKVNLWTLDINPILPGEKPVLPKSKSAIAKLQQKGLLPKFMNAVKTTHSLVTYLYINIKTS